MKNLTLLILATLTLALGSNAFAAKSTFERTKPHLNVGTLGETDTSSLTLALAVAAGNPLEKAIDDLTGTVTATVETESFIYVISSDSFEVVETEASEAYFVKVDTSTTTEAKPSEAYFVRCDRSTMTSAQTREHILLARQVDVPVVVFLDLDGFADSREVEACAALVQEVLSEAGYSKSNSGIVAGSVGSALAGEKDGLMALVDLLDELDRCMGY